MTNLDCGLQGTAEGVPERLALPPGGLRVPVKTHGKLCKEFAALNVVQVSSRV